MCEIAGVGRAVDDLGVWTIARSGGGGTEKRKGK